MKHASGLFTIFCWYPHCFCLMKYWNVFVVLCVKSQHKVSWECWVFPSKELDISRYVQTSSGTAPQLTHNHPRIEHFQFEATVKKILITPHFHARPNGIYFELLAFVFQYYYRHCNCALHAMQIQPYYCLSMQAHLLFKINPVRVSPSYILWRTVRTCRINGVSFTDFEKRILLSHDCGLKTFLWSLSIWWFNIPCMDTYPPRI